jgi:hypothetical protein
VSTKVLKRLEDKENNDAPMKHDLFVSPEREKCSLACISGASRISHGDKEFVENVWEHNI